MKCRLEASRMEAPNEQVYCGCRPEVFTDKIRPHKGTRVQCGTAVHMESKGLV